jgi:hypothetical protein
LGKAPNLGPKRPRKATRFEPKSGPKKTQKAQKKLRILDTLGLGGPPKCGVTHLFQKPRKIKDLSL